MCASRGIQIAGEKGVKVIAIDTYVTPLTGIAAIVVIAPMSASLAGRMIRVESMTSETLGVYG